jgi:hypothetical protein
MAKPRLPRTREEQNLCDLNGARAEMMWGVVVDQRVTNVCAERETAERLAERAIGEAVRVPVFQSMVIDFGGFHRYHTTFIPAPIIRPSLEDLDLKAIRAGATPRELALMQARRAGLTEEEIALLATP